MKHSRPEEALDAGGDSTPLYHLPGGHHHSSLQDNIANISGPDPGLTLVCTLYARQHSLGAIKLLLTYLEDK